MPSLFDKLPFVEAIDALRDRLAMPKPEFLRLDAANRSRAFTMAWVSDRALLENIHDEIAIAINNGETYADFRTRLEELKERSGWTGTSPWHYRVVYDQNLGMAYSAGRVQQGQASGLSVWRYLPSVAADPRAEHEPYYNNLYRMAAGSPVPPIDFGCNCGWEWVFEDELDAPAESYPVFDPPVPRSGFVWSATNYFDLSSAVSANAEIARRGGPALPERIVAHAAIEAVPNVVQSWFEAAVEQASKLAESKFERAAGVFESAGQIPLTTLRDWLEIDSGFARKLMAALRDEDEQELHHQVTLATLLKGREETMRPALPPNGRSGI